MKSTKKKQEKILKEILEEAEKITTVSDNENWIVLDPNGPLTQSLLKELKLPNPDRNYKLKKNPNVNGFYHVDEHSHYWTSIDMFLNYLKTMKALGFIPEKDADYMIEGFENTKKNGYDIIKWIDELE